MHYWNIVEYIILKENLISYRAFRCVIVNSPTESNVGNDELGVNSSNLSLVKNAGCLGGGKEFSLPSMRTTDDIVGLSSA